MSDILSQEQIDALLSSDSFENNETNSENSGQSTSDKTNALSNFFEIFCTQAGNVISTVVNKKTTFTPQGSVKADLSVVNSKINAVVLSLALSFKSGLEGEFYLILAKKEVAILSDLMTMGDGNAEYSEDHKDAIGELFNQVMGAFCVAIGTDMGITVSADNVAVNEFDLDNPPFPADSLDMVEATLDLETFSQSSAFFLLPEAITEQIAKKSKKTDNSPSVSDQVGLSMSEIDDLSRVTSFDSSDSSFQETSLTGHVIKESSTNIDMLLDIELDVSIELGRSLLSIKRVLELAPGSIVELDRMAGEPVDLLVNNKVVAKGEVVVIDESFGIRIVSLVSAEERIKSLR
ncbi:MAG TPA: flagellar motor switch protein FliN [Chitinispirillaceae bacterium]|nr:flagellar motor switch protein FliN [Chitinispirillaceae bacterium]